MDSKSLYRLTLRISVILIVFLSLGQIPAKAAEMLKEVHGFRPVISLEEANAKAASEGMPEPETQHAEQTGRKTTLSDEHSRSDDTNSESRPGLVESKAELKLTPVASESTAPPAANPAA